MNSKRLYWMLLGIVALLVVALVAGTYGANKLLSSQASNLTSLKAKNQALAQEQQSLVKAKKEISKYSSLMNIAKIVVPQDKSQAEAIREIFNIAGSNGIQLTSISFPGSSLGTSTTGASSSSSSTPTPSNATATPNISNLKTANLSQLQAVKNLPGVYLLPISIDNSGHATSYPSFINFLKGLESNRRTSQVTSVDISPDSTDRTKLTFVLTISEYIKP